jgi:hypothetical protein
MSCVVVFGACCRVWCILVLRYVHFVCVLLRCGVAWFGVLFVLFVLFGAATCESNSMRERGKERERERERACVCVWMRELSFR